MERIVLKATRREVTGKKVRFLRREGKLPAVLFGYGVDSTPITLELKDSAKTLATVGSSTLVTLDLEGKEYNVLVRERQQDVIYRTLTHVDFQAVSMTETVRAQVAITIVGDEDIPAVENYGAIINTGIDELEIECLPQDLPERIEVDLSGLAEIGDSILVKDLPLPLGVVALDDPEALVVVVSSPIAEEEEEEEEVLDEDLEPEVIERVRADEEGEE
jgi:large subunit ribosomal protein L25